MTPKWARLGSRDLLFEFWDPLRNVLTGEATHLFFHCYKASIIRWTINYPKGPVVDKVMKSYFLNFIPYYLENGCIYPLQIFLQPEHISLKGSNGICVTFLNFKYFLL